MDSAGVSLGARCVGGGAVGELFSAFGELGGPGRKLVSSTSELLGAFCELPGLLR